MSSSAPMSSSVGFQVGLPLLEVGDAGDVPFNRGFAPSHPGGALRVFPKIGLGAFLLEFLQFVPQSRQVKDASVSL